MKQQRIISLDLIRTVAILLVITQHAWSGLHLDEPGFGIGNHIYQALVVMGVPLFFMLSGALMLGGKPLPIGQFLSRRFKRLLLPYLLWATLVYIISAVMHKYPDVHTSTEGLLHYLPYLLSGKINPSYWYIFVLMGLYLLTPFMQQAFSALHAKRLTEYGLILWMAWLMLRAYYPQFGSMHYYSASAFSYMGFFLCGHYCVRYLTDERRNRCIGAVGFAAAYALNVWGLVDGFSTSLAHTLGVVSLFLLLKSCVVPNKFSSFITSSGRYTYVIYFVHVPLIGVLCMLNVWGWCPLWICPIVITLLSFIISYWATWLLYRFRFVPNMWVGISP